VFWKVERSDSRHLRQSNRRSIVGGEKTRIGALPSAIGTVKSLGEIELNFALSMVKGIKPRDDTEAMLASQMAATDNAVMTAAWRLSKVQNSEQRDSASAMLNKTARTFVAQLEAPKRYRSNGEQIVKVQHIAVSNGGQAIVTDTMQTGTGGHEKIEHQPHEQDARGPALLSNSEANTAAMPGASGSGLECVPMPRGTRRGTNGRA
jgi:hypothetical protein